MKLRSKSIALTIAAVAAVLAVVGAIVWQTGGSMNRSDSAVSAGYTGHGGTLKNTLADMDTPDPSVVYRDGYYYMTFTHNGADIMVMKSRTLDFRQAEKRVVWYPPVDTMYSANLWAPEIQYLRGKWYIYFAADDGANENHRMYALEAETDDPLGPYAFAGQVTDDTNKWAIDGLVMELENRLYFVWSGWEGDVNVQQNTYIAPMSDPLTVSGPRVKIGEPDLEWERAGGPPYIHEGQSILQKDGRTFIVYSGAGSWTPFYSLGLLTLEPGADPLSAANWRKSEAPLMAMDEEAGVYGPGHNSFVASPDGTETWIVYHATSGISDGWNNRKARAQRVVWRDDGLPEFGKPLSLETAIGVPSSDGLYRTEHAVREGGRVTFDLIPSSVETSAPVLLHYRNETGEPARVTIEAGDGEAAEVELSVTENGKTGYAYATVRLRSGMNEISVTAQEAQEEDGGPQLLAIEIPRYEAENAQAEGDSAAEDNPFASGWGVAKLEGGKGSAVRFGNVLVPTPGDYIAKFAIANPSGQELTIEVAAGDARKKIKAGPTGRNEFAVTEIKLPLRAGLNEITLKLEQAGHAVSVDYMDLVR
ncbi:alpha-N-arabinofuranosidase [Cohnella sp. CIP 111063]|uniref:family 43 glycosylhydrolase n=1 Tax=unclassified Cohnella TaxID=2636738 RepID=UPI000B9CA462|nr:MULTISPECIES: family 43 glycosylhydrolase [unclassified Cohnella]OXS61721.1 alpha-N-arabinofuranosidase [Cohnella sp. CIP 111063]PRX74154.1 GH43 family beta-xylosidase [Cohnella sp. SGD-V74]